MIREIHYWDSQGNEQIRYFDTRLKRFISKSAVTQVDEVIRKHPEEIRLKEAIALKAESNNKERKATTLELLLRTYDNICTTYCPNNDNPPCKEDFRVCPTSLHYENYKYHHSMGWLGMIEKDLDSLELRVKKEMENKKKWK